MAGESLHSMLSGNDSQTKIILMMEQHAHFTIHGLSMMLILVESTLNDPCHKHFYIIPISSTEVLNGSKVVTTVFQSTFPELCFRIAKTFLPSAVPSHGFRTATTVFQSLIQDHCVRTKTTVFPSAVAANSVI